VRWIALWVLVSLFALPVQGEKELPLDQLGGEDSPTAERYLLNRGVEMIEPLTRALQGADDQKRAVIERLLGILEGRSLFAKARTSGRLGTLFGDRWLLLNDGTRDIGYFHYSVSLPEDGGAVFTLTSFYLDSARRERHRLESTATYGPAWELVSCEHSLMISAATGVSSRKRTRATVSKRTARALEVAWTIDDEEAIPIQLPVNALLTPLIPLVAELLGAESSTVSPDFVAVDPWSGQEGSRITWKQTALSEGETAPEGAHRKWTAGGSDPWTAWFSENGRLLRLDGLAGQLVPSTAQVCEALGKEPQK
jgi:hypothetical protein